MLAGLDINATRARAVRGKPGDYPLPMPLDAADAELPMAVNLEQRRPVAGRAGAALARRLPHLSARDFLHCLGQDTRQRWSRGRRSFDATALTGVIFQHLQPALAGNSAVVVLPAYLSPEQAALVRVQGEKHSVNILGSVPSLLAAAMAGYAEQAWMGSVLVADIDDHALSLGLLHAVAQRAHVLETVHVLELGLAAWQQRLIDALADCCIWQSRRDPRASGAAEQSLFDQLDPLCDAALAGRLAQVAIESPQWYQNLLVEPEQTCAFCQPMVEDLAGRIEQVRQRLSPDERPRHLLLTSRVARLPGVESRLRQLTADWRGDVSQMNQEDFGEDLLHAGFEDESALGVLSADAPARAAHGLGLGFLQGELTTRHLERSAPLPAPQALEAGPPRLHFLGQEYLITGPDVVVGARDDCQIRLDAERFPAVAPRHCEILYDQQAFVLFNRGREWTQVNETQVDGSAVLRAGDRIRLGEQGPVLRFLGSV